MNPKVSNLQLSQRLLIVSKTQEETIQWGAWLLANVPKSKTVQPLPFDVQLADHGTAAQEFLFMGDPCLSVLAS
jgi:hypothetical protein